MEGLDLSKVINPCEMMKLQREERRWSERLMTQAEDKVHAHGAGTKRTLEGNISNLNTFAILGDDNIIARANDMGVKMTDNDFPSINLLVEMEEARLLLHRKIVALDPERDITETIQNDLNIDDNSIGIDSLDENTDLDEHVLVSPKRCRKPNKKLLFSGSVKKRRVVKAGKISAWRGVGIHRETLGFPKNPSKKNQKLRKKHERSHMKL